MASTVLWLRLYLLLIDLDFCISVWTNIFLRTGLLWVRTKPNKKTSCPSCSTIYNSFSFFFFFCLQFQFMFFLKLGKAPSKATETLECCFSCQANWNSKILRLLKLAMFSVSTELSNCGNCMLSSIKIFTPIYLFNLLACRKLVFTVCMHMKKLSLIPVWIQNKYKDIEQNHTV